MTELRKGMQVWVDVTKPTRWGWVSRLPVIRCLVDCLRNRWMVRHWRGRQVKIGGARRYVVDVDAETSTITLDLPIDAEALNALMEGRP